MASNGNRRTIFYDIEDFLSEVEGVVEVEETEDEEEDDEEEDEGEEDDEEYVPPTGGGSVDIREEDMARMQRASARQQIEAALRQREVPRRRRGENVEAVHYEEVEDEVDVLEISPSGQPHAGGGGGGGGGGRDRIDICPGGVESEEVSGLGRSCESETDLSSSNCPICMERWTREGVHRVCCISCGHVYGRSCLERWLQQCGKKIAKCPQCNRKFKKSEIINLYAPQIAVVNDDLEKEVSILRAKNESLNLENKILLEQVCNHKKHERERENFARQKKACLHQVSSGRMRSFDFDYYNERQIAPSQMLSEPSFVSQNSGREGNFNGAFVLQNELEVDGARVLDIDASSQILLISRKGSGWRGEHFLTKISLLAPNDMENALLPANTGSIRDLHISPSNTILPGRLALLASLGKKLSVFSLESNNEVLKYDLPGPSWSCSWDFNTPYHIYAGLQNGMILVFDIRQTARALESIGGLSGHPVHTIHSLVRNEVDSSRTLLTASSVGPCLWDVSDTGSSPFLVPETENQGVCISLACGSSSDDIVASFRPKVEISNDTLGSQPSPSPSPTVTGPTRLGTHVLFMRVDGNLFQKREMTSGNVSEVRMSRSAIICVEGSSPLFAYGDEAFRGICVWSLPSFQVIHRLKPHQHPILDVKYASSTGPGILSCISENRLQVFTCF